jgi:hypothetical protein
MIRVCTPYYNVLHPETVESVERLNNVEWMKCRGTYIGKARNALVNDRNSSREFQSLNDRFSHYLFIDADISFEPEAVEKLIACDLDVVGGIYWDRSDRGYTGGWLNKKTGGLGRWLKRGKGVVPVDWIGAGALLVKAGVFETTAYPWFRHTLNEYWQGDVKYAEEHGEDIGFCLNASEYGYKTYACLDAIFTHHTGGIMSGKDFANVSDEAKKAIIEQELQVVHNTIYQQTINARVAKAVGDDKLYKVHSEALKKLHQKVDLFNEELSSIGKSRKTPASRRKAR